MSFRAQFVVVLFGATVALLWSLVLGASADTLSDLTRQLMQSEPLIPDGTVAAADPLPYGNTIHVVSKDNMDSWKIQVSSGTVSFEQDQCDSTETPLPTGALHLVVVPGVGPLTYARLRSTRYHRTYLRDLTRLDYYTCDTNNNGQQWPFIVLEIDWNGDNVIDDELIFEPSYQNAGEGGTCGALKQSGYAAPIEVAVLGCAAQRCRHVPGVLVVG